MIPGLERSLAEGKGYPLQYSGLETSIDRIVHGIAESHKTEWLSHSLSLFTWWECREKPGSVQHRGLLGQWAYFVWYDDGCMSSYIFPTQRGSNAIKTRYKLWVIVMYQCALLSKRDTVVVNDEMRNLCTFPSISLWTLNFSKKQSIKNRARNSAPNMFLHDSV